MTEETIEIIKTEISKLPNEVQEILMTFDWVGRAEEIGKKYVLNENEINDFQIETMLVLLGLADEEDYAASIENNIETTKNEAEKMAEEVREKIFIPIHDLIGENIKKNLEHENIKPAQNVDFILSGGDYAVFLRQNETHHEVEKTSARSAESSADAGGDKLIGTQSMQDIKNKLVD